MPIRSTLKTLFVAGTTSVLMAGLAFAAAQGTAAEAEVMAKKAVAFIKANGPEKAAEEFTNGKDLIDLKDPDHGKLQEKAMYVERVGDTYVGVGICK